MLYYIISDLLLRPFIKNRIEKVRPSSCAEERRGRTSEEMRA